MKKKQDKINDALLKVALGCKVAEVTEEYAEVDGELKLTKRKETKKDIPPDLKAVQLLLSGSEQDCGYERMSDEELEAEKNRLLGMLSGGGVPSGDLEKSVTATTALDGEGKEKKMVKRRRMKRAGTR